MKTIEKNILTVDEGIIVHQVNMLGIMGGGLALQIKKKWPQVFTKYELYCRNWLVRLGDVIYADINPNLYVANLFGQEHIGSGLQTDYAAVEQGMLDIAEYAKENNLQV